MYGQPQKGPPQLLETAIREHCAPPLRLFWLAVGIHANQLGTETSTTFKNPLPLPISIFTYVYTCIHTHICVYTYTLSVVYSYDFPVCIRSIISTSTTSVTEERTYLSIDLLRRDPEAPWILTPKHSCLRLGLFGALGLELLYAHIHASISINIHLCL